MGFKEIIQADINNVFLNNDEFSDMHMVNGSEMPVIIDEMELNEREKKLMVRDGTYKKQKLIYVSAKDYGNPPKINRPFALDDRAYLVKEVTEEDGMYSITLEANTGGK